MKKLTIIHACVFTLVVLLLSGFAGSQVKSEAKKQVKTTEVQIIIKQPKIYGSVVRKNVRGTLSAGAAENSREERAKRNARAIRPVVKALNGYKVKSLARQVYDLGLKQVGWLNTGNVKIVNRYVSDSERYDITRKSKADVVLFVEVDYRLNDTFKAVEVETKTYMYREIYKEPGINPEVIYRNYHTYKWDLPNNADGLHDHGELAKKWSEKKAAVLKEKIKEGLDAELKHLVAALEKS